MQRAPVTVPPLARPDTEATWRVVLAAGCTVLAWASAFVVIRFVGQSSSPGGLSLGRLAIGSVCLSAMMLVGRRWVPMGRRDWALTLLIGVLWFGVYNVALNAGEQHVDAGTAAMLIQVAPILIGILAGFLLGEGFPRMLVIGGLVAFAGTLLIGVATGTGRMDVVGVLLVLLAAVLYAVAVVGQKVVLRRIPGLQVTWLACVIGTVACLPFLPALIDDLSTAPAGADLGMLYLGVVPTAAAFVSWAYALTRSSAGRLGATTYAVPPIAILLAGCSWTRCRCRWPSSAASFPLSAWASRAAAAGSNDQRAQLTWNDRFAMPYQKPFTALCAPDQVSALAPSETNNGAKCSVRGWARRAAGARCSKSRTASTSPDSTESLAHASNSRPQPGAAPLVSPKFASERLWVVKPDPMISTPLSRSGASRRPISNNRRGCRVGMDTCRTGMSAPGYICTNGT